jgi:hypothetical protein
LEFLGTIWGKYICFVFHWKVALHRTPFFYEKKTLCTFHLIHRATEQRL